MSLQDIGMSTQQSKCSNITGALNHRSYIYKVQSKIGSISDLYQDIVERVLNVATPTEALKDEPMCFVYRQEYQSAGSGMETHLDSLSQLLGTYGTTFVE